MEEAAGRAGVYRRVDIQRQTNIQDHTQGQFGPAKLSWGGGGGGVLEELQRDQLELKKHLQRRRQAAAVLTEVDPG